MSITKPARQDTSQLWVKTGLHSIQSTNLDTGLLVDESNLIGDPDFVQRFGTTLRDSEGNFQLAAGVGYQIGSSVSLSTSGGGFDAPFQLWGTILSTNAAPIPIGDPVVRHDLHVHAGPARELGRFTATAVSALMQGGVPSERFVISAIQPNLAITDIPTLKNITASLLEGWEFYDNSYMYAKLWHYVMLSNFFIVINVVPVPNAFPAATVPTWINLTAANLYGIPDAITRRDIVFVENIDTFNNATDLQLIYWLVVSGMRIDGPGGAQTPHQCYIEWSGIPITVLAGVVPHLRPLLPSSIPRPFCPS